MAITSSAKKAHRASLVKKVYNDRRKLTLKKAVRSLSDSLAEKNISVATTNLSRVYKALDKAVKTGVIKKGNADRRKSRMAIKVAKAV